MYSSDAYRKLPTTVLNVQGKTIEFLVDSGATNSVLKKTLFPGQKLSGRQVFSKSASGTVMSERFTTPMMCVHTETNDPQPDRKAKCSFLLSPVCPVNLLGRDLMCEFGIGVVPTSTGLKVIRFDKNNTWSDIFMLEPTHTSLYIF